MNTCIASSVCIGQLPSVRAPSLKYAKRLEQISLIQICQQFLPLLSLPLLRLGKSSRPPPDLLFEHLSLLIRLHVSHKRSLFFPSTFMLGIFPWCCPPEWDSVHHPQGHWDTLVAIRAHAQ